MKKLLTILFLCLAFISNAQTVSITSSASGAICAGTNVTFTATATGFTTPSYQWFKNSVAISGATSSTYSSTTLSNSDQIYVTVTPGYTAGSISTTGLIANFDAANYNTTSTRWNDLSSSANHMDLYTDRTYSTLKTATYSTEGGGSLNVNNNSVFGKTISNTGISGNGGKTMSAWVKIDATDVDWASVASIGEYAATKVFEIYAERNGTTSQLIFHWAGGQVKANPNLPKNTWYHVTIKSDGSNNNYIYINGVQEGYSIQTLNITNSPLYMGAPKTYSQGGWNDNLRGKISTISLYNTALSAQTILDNYNATKGRYTSNSVNSNTITSSITAGPTVSLSLTGDGCVNKSSLSATTGLSSYVWYKDDAMISGATTNTYTPSVAGAYKVNASNGTCSTASAATTIYTCGVTADGRMRPTSSTTTLVSNEGGINFGTGVNELGLIFNTTGLTTTKGSITATNAVLGGVISATNAITSSIGLVYSTDANFGTYSSSTILSNVSAGTYTSTISGLASSTNYYAKSFIINSAGTTFGNVVSFTTSAAFSAPIIVTNGLLLNLDAADPASYSGSGTTWKDLSGNNNNATLISGASYDATTGSIVTNGINQYITVPIFNTSITNITMQTWVYINANTKGSFMSNGGNDGYSIGIGSAELGINGNTPIMLFQAIRYIDAAPITYPTGWHLVTMTMDASAVPSIYIDGTYGNSFPGSNPRTPVTSNFNLGAVPADGGKYYNGKFATAYFYDRVLSASEITQNYNAVKARFGY